jgi:hypothetical protein
MRVNENRFLVQALQQNEKFIRQETFYEPELEKKEEKLENIENSNNFPLYEVKVNTPNKRPKSTTYIDWRGHLSSKQSEIRPKSK